MHSHDNIYYPAEWEPQSAMQLTWPHAATDWQPYYYQITATFLELARCIAEREKLIIAAQEPDEVKALLYSQLSEAQLRNISIYYAPTNDTWARDHAFISLLDHDTGTRYLEDFRFNGWGEKFSSQKDNSINDCLFFQKAISGILENHNDFVLEGGSIESDGHGTILTTTSCLMAPHRNQPLSSIQIESRLKQWLHSERILWVDHGNLMGDDTDGHIDTIVRFAPDDTLLYIRCSNPYDPQYEDFRLLEEQLKSFRTIDGRSYRLLPLPMPDAIYDGETRLPATYANFVIINGAVIVPTYRQKDKDEVALGIIGDAFPGREILPVDATTVVRQHGSLHCLTMQYPSAQHLK